MTIKDFTPNTPTLSEQIAIAQARACAKGTFHTIAYKKELILSEKYAFAHITKISVISGRFAIDYDNQAMVIENRANGAEKGQLRGFETIEEDFLYRSTNNGNLALRFTPFDGGKHETVWYENGKETTIEELLTKYPASQLKYRKPTGERPATMMVYAGNILQVQ